MLAADEIEANAATYQEQVDRILDTERVELRRNGEWFAGMGLEDLFGLASRATVNQLLRRNDFGDRLEREEPISVLELLYPLMQAYDSVAVAADIELGGTDQLFNLMLGREIQEAFGQPAQTAITMPILPGTDGVMRMSKSTGNYIGVSEPPEEQFGKVMRLPDEALGEWYRLLAHDAPQPSGHPGEEKRRLGRLLVDRFHGDGAGDEAEAHFNRVIRDRSVPDEVPTAAIPAADTLHLPEVLVSALGVASRSEARRLIAQGGVSIDGEPVEGLDISAERIDGRVLRAGKRRFARIQLGS
jgi:tyrosyl-tRNA synthetase